MAFYWERGWHPFESRPRHRWQPVGSRIVTLQLRFVHISVPHVMLFGVRADVKLECLASCRSADNPPKYLPMSFADYLAELEPKNYVLTKAPA